MRTTLILIAVTVGVGFGALWHGLGYMDTFNTSAAPEVLSAAPLPVAQAPRQGRLALVVVDGLRDDDLDLLGLAPLLARHHHVRCTVRATIPTFSRPNYVALLSGIPAWASGVRNNDHVGTSPAEGVFDVARRAGWRTLGWSDGIDTWAQLYPRAFEDPRFMDRASFDRWFATAAPSPQGSALLLHIDRVDAEAHEHGLGDGYVAAARSAGGIIQTLLSRLDLTHDTVVITADHGHIDRGGHGGPESEVVRAPLLALGRGVAAGHSAQTCTHAIEDVPATIAVLLGIPAPAASFGTPIAEVVGPPTALTAAAGPRLTAADPTREVSWPLAGVALGLWLLLGALLAVVARGHTAALAARAVAFPLLFAALYALLEPTLSLSAVWERGPWIQQIMLLAGAAGVLAWLVTTPLRRWTGGSPQAQAAWIVWAATLPFAVAAGLHGHVLGGPELGSGRAAFALLVADFVILVGGAAALGLLVWAQLRPGQR